MSYPRLIAIAAATACAICAATTSTALALPTILPTTITSLTGGSIGSVEAVKANGETMTCQGLTSSSTVETNGHLGLYTSDIRGCQANVGGINVKCTGEGESEGVILQSGSWHLVYDTLSVNLASAGLAVLDLTSRVKFKCTSLASIELLPGGMELCLVLNPTALTKIFEGHCSKAASGNRPFETKYYNEAGTLVGIVPLLANKNGGTFEELVLVGLGTVLFPAAALLMA